MNTNAPMLSEAAGEEEIEAMVKFFVE